MANIILIVDDSATIRASLKHTLDQAGYEVHQANDGKHGLEQLEKLSGGGAKVSMVISDVNMPNMDGLTMIRQMKSNAQYKFTPVLVLTTESQDSKKLEGKNAGAAGWLVKPFDPATLISVVRKFVR